MGNFSIWFLIIVILVPAITVGTFLTIHYRNKIANSMQLKGFGGWMLLLAISVYIAPLWNFVDFAKNQQELPQVIREKFPVMVNEEIALTVSFIVNKVIVAIQMARKRASFVQYFMWLFVFTCALLSLDIA